MINPINQNWYYSYALMDPNATFVTQLVLRNEPVTIPSSIFCLKNLRYLYIKQMSFRDGIVPDGLGDLKELRVLDIYASPIVNMPDQLGALSKLQYLNVFSCSLIQLSNLSGIPWLYSVYLTENRLSRIDGLNDATSLNLRDNLFTEIPTFERPSNLQYLYMDNNPLKNILAIISHPNLWRLSLVNTSLSSVPPTIDRLQQLQELYLSHNKLFYLPTNILSLSNLRLLDIRNNLFSSADLQTLQALFNASLPNMTFRY